MRKKFKVAMSILLMLLTLSYSLLIPNRIVKSSEISTSIASSNSNLILDSSKYKDMPKHFRKSSDLTNIKNTNDLNLNGLDTLNISGSSEFSEYNLPLLIKGINTSMPIAIVDLRQESHGFINGIPVSWTCCDKNKANLNLTRDEVIATENKLLNSINLNEPLYFYNHPDISIIPKAVLNEEQLSASKSLYYIRIPVTDGKLPTDDMVDYFVESIKSAPKNTWMHFHCKHGIGRTTTFMIMYDMFKNSKKASADEIIKRQLVLSGLTEKHVKSFYNNERYSLLKNFHKYCSEHGDNFDIKWSDWKKASNITGYKNHLL
ncbi:MAG: phytase [Clostridium sp.]|nr:phytase [Clostridium sp.]